MTNESHLSLARRYIKRGDAMMTAERRKEIADWVENGGDLRSAYLFVKELLDEVKELELLVRDLALAKLRVKEEIHEWTKVRRGEDDDKP